MEYLVLAQLLVGEWSYPGSCDEFRSVFTDVREEDELRVFYNLEKQGTDWVQTEEFLWWLEGDTLYHSRRNSCQHYPVKVLSFTGDSVRYCATPACAYKFEIVKCPKIGVQRGL